jgi:hypothetical protein
MDKLTIIANEQLQSYVDNILADAIIREMSNAGLSPDDMLRVIALAKEKYEAKQKKNKNSK